MTMVHKLSGAGEIEGIDEMDLHSGSDSQDGEDLIGEAYEDLEQLARDQEDSGSGSDVWNWMTMTWLETNQ